jgi:hypothetical protein
MLSLWKEKYIYLGHLLNSSFYKESTYQLKIGKALGAFNRFGYDVHQVKHEMMNKLSLIVLDLALMTILR